MVDLIAGRISVPPKSAIIPSGLRRRTGWNTVPEKRVVGAEGADVEIDVNEERLEEDGEGGFQGCDAGGHAS